MRRSAGRSLSDREDGMQISDVQSDTYRHPPIVWLATVAPLGWASLLLPLRGFQSFLPAKAIAALLLLALAVRFSRIRVVMSLEGLSLYNFFRTYRFEWFEISHFELRAAPLAFCRVRLVLRNAPSRAASALWALGGPSRATISEFESLVATLNAALARWVRLSDGTRPKRLREREDS